MDEPLILYSTNTWLAYAIAERFYGGVHHAWCSPVYDGATAARHVNIPPSSSPAEIYRALAEDAHRGERHSELFRRNVMGVIAGAGQKLQEGVITRSQHDEIEAMATNAHPREFRPILYVIHYARVRDRVYEVDLASRAHPFSVEFRVPELPRNCFDAIETRG
jgi:hypothetical protein